jgi:hypothetical protein
MLTFFVLVFVLSIPFWAAGALSASQLLPALLISALGFLCPAAAILAYRVNGRAGVAALFKRSFDFGRIGAKGWLAPVILLQPGIMALSYRVIRLAGTPIPAAQFSFLTAFGLLVVFFFAGLGEELGCRDISLIPCRNAVGRWEPACCLGWSGRCGISSRCCRRSGRGGFMAWWSLGTLASRVIIVWLYNNNGKSVFVAAVFHAIINLTWQLFPVNGSYYDPRVTGLIAAVVAVVVVIVWGPRTLTRRNQAGLTGAKI